MPPGSSRLRKGTGIGPSRAKPVFEREPRPWCDVAPCIVEVHASLRQSASVFTATPNPLRATSLGSQRNPNTRNKRELAINFKFGQVAGSSRRPSSPPCTAASEARCRARTDSSQRVTCRTSLAFVGEAALLDQPVERPFESRVSSRSRARSFLSSSTNAAWPPFLQSTGHRTTRHHPELIVGARGPGRSSDRIVSVSVHTLKRRSRQFSRSKRRDVRRGRGRGRGRGRDRTWS
jgi:hypothetical protein